jgi:diaminopimelate epimerase
MKKFTKMHGTGNDYIYINAMEEPVVDPSALAIRWSDRHFGIGADGLVLIEASRVADFKMRMFNADGSEAEMCGNASRCVAKYVYEKGLTKKKQLSLETKAGIKELDLFVESGRVISVCVDMGEPILDPPKIPVITSQKKAIKMPFSVGDTSYEVTAVSMGNPHAIIVVPHVDQLNLTLLGPYFEHHPAFPKRTNVEFLEILSPWQAKMRVWERGSGETMACGTGACASLVAAVLCCLMEPKARIDVLGGSLGIEWDRRNNHIYLTGEAKTVFEGEWMDE